MEREVGGGIGMGNTCKPMAVLFQCMTKFTTNKKKKKNAALNMPANFENSAVATGLEKVSFIPSSKKGNAKEFQTTAQLHSFHTLAK